MRFFILFALPMGIALAIADNRLSLPPVQQYCEWTVCPVRVSRDSPQCELHSGLLDGSKMAETFWRDDKDVYYSCWPLGEAKRLGKWRE